MSMGAIAKTALWVAAMRAVESERSDAEGRLFVDPFARALAGPEGFAILKAYRDEVGETPPVIAVRTRYFDEHVAQALDRGVRQLVILAAGMDARAFRLPFPDGVRLFEVDQQAVLDYKQAQLGGAEPHCERHVVGVDLRDDWPAQLVRAGLDAARPTLWLIEGLLVYPDETAVATLFTRVGAVSAPGSIMLFDATGRTLLESQYLVKQRAFARRLNAPWQFGVDEPEALMARFGWQAIAVEPAEVAPARWPFARAPRHVTGVPRSFLVEARKA